MHETCYYTHTLIQMLSESRGMIKEQRQLHENCPSINASHLVHFWNVWWCENLIYLFRRYFNLNISPCNVSFPLSLSSLSIFLFSISLSYLSIHFQSQQFNHIFLFLCLSLPISLSLSLSLSTNPSFSISLYLCISSIGERKYCIWIV